MSYNFCEPGHPTAFYDENGLIVDLLSFGEHEDPLADTIASLRGFAGHLSICKLGKIKIGDTWDGEKIIPSIPPPSPFYVKRSDIEEDPELADIPGVIVVD